ncbi:Ig-like domain-containing protein [Krasilnikovia sp. M28-CT-15]|uniref:Ig-like domain-containing protein n=1 Tax=Krasilnikovia sp. M28-CT-15 TaxID=3373540 RepID=UPI003876AC4E
MSWLPRNFVVVTTATIGALLAPTAAAAATVTHTTTVSGTFSRVVLDGGLATPTAAYATRTVTQPVVTIDDTMLPLPDSAAAGLSPETEVVVKVTAPTSVDTPAEVAAAVDNGAAQIIDADPAPVAAALPPTKAGAHTLTVLPVYWTAPDSQTPTTLRASADKLAAYWNEQTAGGITIPTIDVRNWVGIPNPGSCNYTAIANAAHAAHGVPAADSRNHYVVYFPSYSSCGWTGLGHLPGGEIWINGYGPADAWEHEFGHNLGLGHANSADCTSGTATVALSTSCTTRSYEDYDVMGYARSGDGYSLNTALSDVLGTLDNAVVASVGSTVTLPAVTSITAARAVKVPLSGSTLYVEYRPKTGRNANEPTGWAGVQVRQLLSGSNESRILNMNPTVANSRALPVGSGWTVTGTTLTLTLEQIDASGARVRVGNIYNDTTPPPAPALPVVSKATAVAGEYVSGPVTFSWPAVTDPESGIREYRVVVNGQQTVLPGTQTTLGVSAFSGPLTVGVTAVNKAGLVGAASPTRTVRGDNAPPSAPVLQAPTSGQTVGATTTVRWAAATDADSGVAGYEILLDAAKVSTVAAPATAAEVTLPALANGLHKLTVSAVDRVGNRSTRAETTVNLSRVTVSPPIGLKAVGDPNGSVISWTASVTSQVTGYDIIVDGVVTATVPATSTSWRLANGLADGAHVVGVRARDAVGNVSTTPTVKAVLDTTGPSQPKVAAPLTGAVVTGNKALVSWSVATDLQSGIAAYVVEVDHVQAALVGGTVHSATVVVPDGSHHIGVIAVNGNGLRSTVADALGVTVTATATAPAPAKITSPVSGKATNADTVSVTWAAAVDGGGLARYEVLLDGQLAVTVNGTTTSATVPLSLGAHTLAVRAVDPTGLVSTSPTAKITAEIVAPTVTAPTVQLRIGSAAGGVPVTLAASAADPSGICAITATANGTLVGTAKAAKLSVSTVLPAGATPASVVVTATDCAGNVTTRTDPVSLTSIAETAGQFSGAWTSLTGTSYVGGAAVSASTAGAAVSATFTGTQVAWIGSKTPTSGAATIYLDGKVVTTVDTRATTTANGQVLWTRATTPGTHTLKIVVVGTAGRPRVLVDGFAVAP